MSPCKPLQRSEVPGTYLPAVSSRILLYWILIVVQGVLHHAAINSQWHHSYLDNFVSTCCLQRNRAMFASIAVSDSWTICQPCLTRNVRCNIVTPLPVLCMFNQRLERVHELPKYKRRHVWWHAQVLVNVRIQWQTLQRLHRVLSFLQYECRRSVCSARKLWLNAGPALQLLVDKAIINSARQHSILYMLSALYAVARPSVRLSVCHTGGSVKNGGSW